MFNSFSIAAFLLWSGFLLFEVSSEHPCDGRNCTLSVTCTVRLDRPDECVCVQGHKGENCEDIDECSRGKRDPCGHRGVCTNTIGSFKCTCLQGWTAPENRCSERTKDNATCLPGYYGVNCAETKCGNGYAVPYNDSTTGSRFRCKCDQGWTNTRPQDSCNTDIDECLDDPCLHGQCNNSVGNYTCLCDFPWNGVHCDYYDICRDKKCTEPTTICKKTGVGNDTYSYACVPTTTTKGLIKLSTSTESSTATPVNTKSTTTTWATRMSSSPPPFPTTTTRLFITTTQPPLTTSRSSETTTTTPVTTITSPPKTTQTPAITTTTTIPSPPTTTQSVATTTASTSTPFSSTTSTLSPSAATTTTSPQFSTTTTRSSTTTTSSPSSLPAVTELLSTSTTTTIPPSAITTLPTEMSNERITQNPTTISTIPSSTATSQSTSLTTISTNSTSITTMAATGLRPAKETDATLLLSLAATQKSQSESRKTSVEPLTTKTSSRSGSTNTAHGSLNLPVIVGAVVGSVVVLTLGIAAAVCIYKRNVRQTKIGIKEETIFVE